jgi:hypothetical protein
VQVFPRKFFAAKHFIKIYETLPLLFEHIMLIFPAKQAFPLEECLEKFQALAVHHTRRNFWPMVDAA